MGLVTRLALRVLGGPFVVADARQSADAIVVLGCLLSPDGSLSPALEERVRAGVTLWREGAAPRLCMTGGRSPLAPHDATEAAAMAAYARSLGVPEDAIEVEDASDSTWENAQRCAALLLPRGIRTVWIVTQPFHLRRAVRHFRRAGFRPLGHHIEDSLQYRHPEWGLRRVLAEYVSWTKTVLRSR